MKMEKSVLIILVLLILGIGYYAFSTRTPDVENPRENNTIVVNNVPDDDTETPENDNSKIEEENQADENTQSNSETDSKADDASVKTFEVSSGSYYFKPNELKVKKGDTVKIVLNNEAGVHDLVIDEFKARTKIIQGEGKDEMTFVADKTGTFEFYCSVGNHRQMGMVGNLIVE